MIWEQVGGPGRGWTGEQSWSGTEVTSTLGGAGAGSENKNISQNYSSKKILGLKKQKHKRKAKNKLQIGKLGKSCGL